MKRSQICLLAAGGLSIYFSSVLAVGDRVISLGNKFFNGTATVEFTTQALGQTDFFKIDPAPNATTWDSWYFDAMNSATNETIAFNFAIHWPTESDLSVASSQYHVSLVGYYANGTAFNIGVSAENANIMQRADKSMRVDYFGGNEISWLGSSLLEPRPVYNVTINSPERGIRGSIILRGNIAAPHYCCGTDAAGVDERNIEGVAWANALPDADATIDLQIGDVSMAFEGYGYHDKTWVDRPFQETLQAAFWRHARLGPYAVVWWHSRAQDGTDISAEYLVTWENGQVIAARCVDNPNNTLGWGTGQIWPLVPDTPAPAGMIMRWDFGDAGWKGAYIRCFEGEETFTDETGSWTLNQLPPL